MNKIKLKLTLTLIIIIIIVAFADRVLVTRAGNISAPGSASATFYTLTQIYNLINSNTTSTEADHSFTFSDSLDSTHYTLTQIYSALASLIDASKVLSGTTYLGTAGTYNAASLSTTTVKKDTSFGVSSTGAYSGFPGTAWTGSGGPSTAATCEANSGWYWFEDANGDGDSTDSEDGVCVQATAVTTTASWNGAEQVTVSNLAAVAINSGSSTTAVDSDATWTVNAYTNHLAKVLTGTGSAIDCWGRVKENSATTITVYGSWLGSNYNACSTNPGENNTISVYDDWYYDNSFIGDWSCNAGATALNGTVTYGSYPTSTQVGSGNIALAIADCYDGQRDLLPTEASRAVASGTATAATATSITDSALALPVNGFVGQKVLITGGTGANTTGLIESNTATAITIGSWSSTAPAIGSTFSIIYIVPQGSYTPDAHVAGGTTDSDAVGGNLGPLTEEVLNNWKGSRLPSFKDFFGICGSGGTAVAGQYKTSCSASKNVGNYGSQIGRTDECLSVSDTSYEWLSGQYYYVSGLVAGGIACSFVLIMLVSTLASGSVPFSARNSLSA